MSFEGGFVGSLDSSADDSEGDGFEAGGCCGEGGETGGVSCVVVVGGGGSDGAEVAEESDDTDDVRTVETGLRGRRAAGARRFRGCPELSTEPSVLTGRGGAARVGRAENIMVGMGVEGAEESDISMSNCETKPDDS